MEVTQISFFQNTYIGKILVKVGERITKGQALFEIAHDSGRFPWESEITGEITEICVREEWIAPAHAPIIKIAIYRDTNH